MQPTDKATELLLQAALTGEVGLATVALAEGASAKEPLMEGGPTALAIAAQEGHAGVAAYLLEQGAPVSAGQEAALRRAAACGHVDVIELLLERGADATVLGDAPFRLACRSSSDAAVARLLRAAAPPPARILAELLEAIRRIDYGTTHLLLDCGIDMMAAGDELLQEVARAGDLSLARMVLSRGVRPRLTHLLLALNYGQSRMVRLMGKFGANLHEDNDTLLSAAAWRKRLGLVWFLLSNGADPNAEGGEPLVRAAEGGSVEVVRLLLTRGADPTMGGFRAIRQAAAKGQVHAFQALLGAIQEWTNPSEAEALRRELSEQLDLATQNRSNRGSWSIASLGATARPDELIILLGQDEARDPAALLEAARGAIRSSNWRTLEVLMPYLDANDSQLQSLCHLAAAVAEPSVLRVLSAAVDIGDADQLVLVEIARDQGNNSAVRWLLDFYRGLGDLNLLYDAVLALSSHDPFR